MVVGYPRAAVPVQDCFVPLHFGLVWLELLKRKKKKRGGGEGDLPILGGAVQHVAGQCAITSAAHWSVWGDCH